MKPTADPAVPLASQNEPAWDAEDTGVPDLDALSKFSSERAAPFGPPSTQLAADIPANNPSQKVAIIVSPLASVPITRAVPPVKRWTFFHHKHTDVAASSAGIAAALDGRTDTSRPRDDWRLETLDSLRDRTQELDQRLAALTQLADGAKLSAAAFETHKSAIDEGLAEARAAAQALKTLETRLGTLEDSVAQLLQRAPGRVADLERRIAEFEARTNAAEREKPTWLAGLEQRAAAVVSDLERRLAELEAMKPVVDDRMAQLQARAAGTINELVQHLANFDTQKREANRALVEATRLMDTLAALESRIARLTAPDSELAHAEQIIDEFEQRATDASLGAAEELEEVRRARGELEEEFARLRKQLQQLADTGRKDAKRLARYREHGERPAAFEGWQWPAIPRRLVIVGGVVLAVLAGVAATGSFIHRGPEKVVPATAVRAPAPPPVLDGRALDVSLVQLPATAAGHDIQSARETSNSSAKPAPTAPAPAAPAPTAPAPTPPAILVAPPPKREAPTTPPPAPEVAAAATFAGSLIIDSDPAGASVFVDQQAVGETPLQLSELRAGSHVVRIEREGYQRWTGAVSVPASKETRVSAKLQPAR